MSTRNLTCVVKDGEFKVAQYGQWDGFPSGQGSTVCEFVCKNLKNKRQLAKFNKRVSQTIVLSNRDVGELFKNETGYDENNADQSVWEDFTKLYPQLDSGMCAGILKFVMDNEGAKVASDIDFAADGLFCEWCYVIDLDNNTLEVYRGNSSGDLSPSNRFPSLGLWEKIPFSGVKRDTPVLWQNRYMKEK